MCNKENCTCGKERRHERRRERRRECRERKCENNCGACNLCWGRPGGYCAPAVERCECRLETCGVCYPAYPRAVYRETLWETGGCGCVGTNYCGVCRPYVNNWFLGPYFDACAYQTVPSMVVASYFRAEGCVRPREWY